MVVFIGPNLLKLLKQTIPNPKKRSKKWLSTSVPQEKWNDDISKYSSAEYHTNNLLNPVLFEETSKLIPSNALVIEIAPHGLLQAILKKSLKDCLNVPLTKRGHNNAIKYFLEGIGELYKAGLNPKVDKLYPKINFPVSTDTPSLSHLVTWEHSEDWLVNKHISRAKMTSIVRNLIISLYDDDYKHYADYIRNGKNIFPEAATLVLVWETFAMSKGKKYQELSVCFRDIHFYTEVTINPKVKCRLRIMISKGTNKFEVCCNDIKLVSGMIFEHNGSYNTFNDNITDVLKMEDYLVTSRDIYTYLYYKGYSCKEYFQSIYSTNVTMDKGYIVWKDDWISFIEGLFQMNVLLRSSCSALKIISALTIDVKRHIGFEEQINDIRMLEAYSCYSNAITRCGGVEIRNLQFINWQPSNVDYIEIQSKTFIPYFFTEITDLITALQVIAQIIAENVNTNNIKILNLSENQILNISENMKLATDKIPDETFVTEPVSTDSRYFDMLVINPTIIPYNLIIIDNLLRNQMKMEMLYKIISRDTFVLAIETNKLDIDTKYELFDVVTATDVFDHSLILLRRKENWNTDDVLFLSITTSNTSWISQIYEKSQILKRVILIVKNHPSEGFIEIVKQLKKTYSNISLIAVDDDEAPTFDPENCIFQEQIRKDLAINIYKQGVWGGIYYISSSKDIKVKNFKVTSSLFGNIDCLEWIEDHQKLNINSVEIHYAGVSKRDAQLATGEIICDTKHFGMDFSGIDSNRQRVMGLVKEGAITKFVNADPDFLWPVPDHWSFEDAATVPLPYALAYYCLAIKCNTCKGCRVFVTGGAGALGQAIISICLALDCKVFTTVSDEVKKNFLLKLFPQLNASNIISGRNNKFYMQTEGNVYDYVISNFTGDLRELAMKCVAPWGYFMDISQYDVLHNKEFKMFVLFQSQSYQSVDFMSVFKPENAEDKKLIQRMITEGIAQGIVKPLTAVVETPQNITRAFRILSSNKHRGRVLIKLTNLYDQICNITPSVNYTSTGSYVIICDESDLGIELANHLVEKGVKNLVIQISTKFKPYTLVRAKDWKNKGISIKVLNKNIDTEAGCVEILNESASLGPVNGVFFIQFLVPEVSAVNIVAKTKLQNTTSLANFDLLSRKLCMDLIHFVVVSNDVNNLSCKLVSSASEMICKARNESGLPALYFQTKLVDLFDMDLQNSKIQEKLKPQTVTSVFMALDNCLKVGYENTRTYVPKKKEVKIDFLDIVFKILGIKSVNNFPNDLKLHELLISESNLEEIKCIMNKYYNLTCTNKEIRDMSIADLKNFHKESKIVKKTDFNGGMSVFYTFIEDDECMGTEPVVPMRTLVCNTNQCEELDLSSTCLFMIPGFEGHHYIFKNLCETLKIQALTLQIPPNLAEESIKGLAANLFKTVNKTFKLKSKFYVLGYSFGVNVALELSALLEKSGHKGVVYCLDSSPDALRTQIDSYLGHLTLDELQNTIITHMYKLMSGQEPITLKQDLENNWEWDDKVKACIKNLKTRVTYSHEYIKSHIETAYRRILWSKIYEPNFVLESQIVLLKGIPHPESVKMPDDYNLSKYSKQPVKIFSLESDHGYAAEDPIVPNVINQFLDSNTLEQFQKKNMCEMYLVDEDKIV